MEKKNDPFMGHGVEITLAQPNDFLKIKETLERIGILSKKDLTLYQSCHILHKQGRYAILHFKSLFALDGKISTLSASDEERTNTIVRLLQEWNLLKVVYPEEFVKKIFAPLTSIKVLSYKEKETHKLVSKYTIGKK